MKRLFLAFDLLEVQCKKKETCIFKEFLENFWLDCNIFQLEDEEGEQCQAKLLNLDRLQVINGGFDYVTGLWTRANCDGKSWFQLNAWQF